MSSFSEEVKVYIAQSLLQFEGICVSEIETKTLLECGEIERKIDEVNGIIIENMLAALLFFKNLNLAEISLDVDFFIQLNAILAKNQALEVGKFRDVKGYIGCVEKAIEPPDVCEIAQILQDLERLDEGNFKFVVSRAFCALAKMQPFFDGNKRTALFLCNIALAKRGLGYFIIKQELYTKFEVYLREFYVNGDTKIYGFLENETIFANV